MRICIDLDGVICQLKKNSNDDYEYLNPIVGAAEKLKALKANGHYIILHTARHMKTCEANVGKVNAKIALKTLKWLEKNEIVYDEIFFGKPWADIYIDDNAFRFQSWEEVEGDGNNLPISNEKQKK